MATLKNASPLARPQSDVLTVEEAAIYLRLSKWQAYKLMRDGDLPYVMVGKRRRLRVRDLEEYLDRPAS